MKEATRERAAISATVEKKALESMARAMPAAVNADHLTVIGVVGAFGVSVGYALSVFSPQWLWLASVMLVVNWFGDSLDGTLARVRNAERPRYGYYLDHAVDAFTTVLIGVGIGFSPFVPFLLAIGLVLLYLIMSINVYLEAHVYGVFRMDYGKIGPTEVRAILIVVNAGLILLIAGLEIHPESIRSIATVVLGAGATGMFLLLLWRFGRNLARLARDEPLDRGNATEGGPAGDAGDIAGGPRVAGDATHAPPSEPCGPVEP